MKTLLLALLLAQANSADPENQLARDILRELIEINTTHSTGSTGKAAEAMAARLRAAGFAPADIQIIGPRPERANLVVRLHGSGAHRPVLLMAHLDVVEARKADWSTDPFQFVEKDGYFYGRGSGDNKSGDTILMTSFIRLKKEG
ncbi:MAG TPA: M20/M25/M40 family metallo-hydrolase, partial [Bryobacteraceae bacterium]|nr:M20/M25/M40 family metallo-hydrolase [Bryobacteraceae bacterium]